MHCRFTMVFFLLFPISGFWFAGEALPAEARPRGRVENAQAARDVNRDESLPEHAVARLGTNRLRKNQRTVSVAYCPNNKWIASVDEGGTSVSGMRRPEKKSLWSLSFLPR